MGKKEKSNLGKKFTDEQFATLWDRIVKEGKIGKGKTDSEWCPGLSKEDEGRMRGE